MVLSLLAWSTRLGSRARPSAGGRAFQAWAAATTLVPGRATKIVPGFAPGTMWPQFGSMVQLQKPPLPHVLRPDEDDGEMRDLIESWRYVGPPTAWDDIVGHERQVLRCREMVERMRRSEDDLQRLGLRLGRGMVISGPAGSGKTMLARALASAAGRDAIVPPTAELTPALIGRLYAQLARMDPVVVILDEAEAIIGSSILLTTNAGCLRAFLAALDGITRPSRGPLTMALTTLQPMMLDPGATRPGRLAPRLELSHPDAAERRVLFERAVARVPVSGNIDFERLVARTGMWTGAEITVAVEEAVSRSLIDGTDALVMDLLSEVIAERYVVEDGGTERWFDMEVSARHEAGHAIYGHLVWPGQVAAVELRRTGGETRLVRRTRSRAHRGWPSLARRFQAGGDGDRLPDRGCSADDVGSRNGSQAGHAAAPSPAFDQFAVRAGGARRDTGVPAWQ